MSLTQAPSIRVLEDYEFMIYVRSEMTIYATLIMFSAGTQQWSQDWNKFQNRSCCRALPISMKSD